MVLDSAGVRADRGGWGRRGGAHPIPRLRRGVLTLGVVCVEWCAEDTKPREQHGNA
jgi:hypothetical protein